MSLLSSRPSQRLPVSSQTKAFKTTQEGLHDLPMTHASVTSPASRNAARNAPPPNIHMAHSSYLQVSAQMSPPHRSFSDHPKWNSNSSHCPSPCSLLILLSVAFSPPRIWWCPIPSTWYSTTVLTALSEDMFNEVTLQDAPFQNIRVKIPQTTIWICFPGCIWQTIIGPISLTQKWSTVPIRDTY